MKLLIVSDSHGDTSYLSEIIQRHNLETLHLGDSEIPKDMFNMRMVRGNSYYDYNMPIDISFKVEEKTIYMTHGHIYDVYNGLTALSLKAQSVNAKYCLFGHTHVPMYAERHGIIFINPGSISRPRNGVSSYMILNTQDDSCVLYNLKGEEIRKYERSN